MQTSITRQMWETPSPNVALLNKGRAGNARVYLITCPEGKYVIKDFRKSPWWIRWTFGRFMIGHEYFMMKQLEGMAGVPQKLFRVDPYAFGMEFVEGETLSAYNDRLTAEWVAYMQLPEATRGKFVPSSRLPVAYYEELEAMIKEMHRRGVTHLDNRNAKNVMILPGEHPGLLDFQAGVYLRKWYPKWFKDLLCLADISGVYKHWFRMHRSLPEDRKELLKHHFKLRQMWMFKGYTFLKKREPKGIERYLFEESSEQK